MADRRVDSCDSPTTVYRLLPRPAGVDKRNDRRRRTGLLPKKLPQLSKEDASANNGANSASRSRVARCMLILLVFLLSAAYMARELKRGWMPHDEGTLAQSAERVLQGELPHHDFDDVYTGGLAFLDAAVFRVMGPDLASLRYAAYAFFLAWVLAMFYAASHFASVPIACALTFMAVAWGYPNYAAAMPSWYNLFLASFGLGALLRYIEVRKRVWLLLAGTCGGLSFLVKLSGLFFISSVLLFLLFREQVANSDQESSHKKTWGYPLFVCGCVLVYLCLLLATIRREFNIVTFGYLFVPGCMVAALIPWQEFRKATAGRHRFWFLSQEVGIFLLGVFIPVILFLTPYLKEGGLGDLFRGVFVLPTQRYGHAAITQSTFKFLGGVIVDVALVWSLFLAPQRVARVARIAFAAGFPAAILLAAMYSPVQRALWSVLWNWSPAAILGGLVLLLYSGKDEPRSADQSQKLFLLLSVIAGCSLIQLPFFVPIYFCYVAPLAVLGCAAVLRYLEPQPPFFLGIVYCSVLCYLLFQVRPGFLSPMGSYYAHDIQTQQMTLRRAGGLRVSPDSARTYQTLGKVIADHARGDYVYATPDCPEIYFLYGFHNPTRTLFEFFDDPVGRSGRILGALHARNVSLVVVNEKPLFSDPIPSDLRAALEKEYPARQVVGPFEVRWKP